MKAGSYINGFDPDGKSEKLCKTCGLCLQNVRLCRWGRKNPGTSMRGLRNGEQTERVLKECTFCYDCNQSCPHA